MHYLNIIPEIGFHIHPEDATEEDKNMMLDICEEYGKVNLMML